MMHQEFADRPHPEESMEQSVQDSAIIPEKTFESVPDAIEHLLKQPEWNSWHPYAINRGRCEEFAEALQKLVGGQIVWLFGKYGAHGFLEVNGNYYDAETPNGVSDPLDIPFAQHYPNMPFSPENSKYHDEMRALYMGGKKITEISHFFTEANKLIENQDPIFQQVSDKIGPPPDDWKDESIPQELLPKLEANFNKSWIARAVARHLIENSGLTIYELPD